MVFAHARYLVAALAVIGAPVFIATRATCQTPAPPPAVPVWTAKVDSVGHVPRIMSPGYTRWRDTSTGWVLHREHMFALDLGQPSPSTDQHVAWLDNGNLVVLQNRPGLITQYTVDGRALNTIGQSGYGPNDFHSRAALAAWHDTVVVYDSDSARVLLFRPDGAFIRTFATGIYDNTVVEVDSRGRLRVEQQAHTDTTAVPRWTFFSLQGKRLDSIQLPPQQAPKRLLITSGGRQAMVEVAFVPEGSWAIDDDGTAIYGNTMKAEFVRTRTGRDTLQLFGRSDLTPAPVDSSRFAFAMGPALRALPELSTILPFTAWPKVAPVWADIVVDDKRYVWVTTYNPTSNAFYGSIYAPGGAYLGWVFGFGRQYTGYAFKDGKLAFPTRDPAGKPVVLVYSIDRRGM